MIYSIVTKHVNLNKTTSIKTGFFHTICAMFGLIMHIAISYFHCWAPLVLWACLCTASCWGTAPSMIVSSGVTSPVLSCYHRCLLKLCVPSCLWRRYPVLHCDFCRLHRILRHHLPEMWLHCDLVFAAVFAYPSNLLSLMTWTLISASHHFTERWFSSSLFPTFCLHCYKPNVTVLFNALVLPYMFYVTIVTITR